MIKFILPFPPSVNSAYGVNKKGRRFKSAKVKAWEVVARTALNMQNVQPASGRVLLEYSLDTPDNYNRDAANYEKYLTDLLVSHGVLKDDSARHVRGIFTYWNDTPGKSVHVTINQFST